MAYYGIYGSFRSSGGTGASHALTSQNHKTLPSSSKRSSHTRDVSPGRASHQYLSPNYSSTWQPRSVSPNRYSTTDYRTAYSRPLLPWPHKEHGGRSLSPGYGYGLDRSKDYVPQPYDHSRVKGFVTSRNTVWTDLSLRYSKTTPRYGGKVVDGYAATNQNPGRRTDGLFPSTYDSGGWRARLAQQGYVASTSKHRRLPERKWHYLDDTEHEEPEEEDFVYRTSRGTRQDEQHDSVISRTRRMKLQVSEETQAVDASVQVDVDELEKHRELEERRPKRTFISSRHHSWYDTGTISYKKYLSPMPWRGSSTNYASSSRYSKMNSSEDNELGDEEKNHSEANKDFRKSVLNVDLPQTEAQLFAKKQAETRWKKTCEDPYCTSEDNSPSETGYDSSCTDMDRSSNDTEGFFTDSLDRSYTFGPGSSYRSSPRSTPFGDEAHFAEEGHFLENVGGGEPTGGDYFVQRVDDGQEDIDVALRDPLADSSDIKNLCFKFKTLNDGSSQRDSGFSEVYNQCDSPGSAHPPDLGTCSHDLKSSRYVGACCDIDQLLMDRDFDASSFQTFEDFDRRVDRQKSNVRTRMYCCEDGFGPEKWSKPARVGLRLDIESCTRFIGTCHDIDEMLGLPTPLSPDSESTTMRASQVAGCPVPDVGDVDGISTTTTSVIGNSDIADLSWLSDHDQVAEHSPRKGWPTRPGLPNEIKFTIRDRP